MKEKRLVDDTFQRQAYVWAVDCFGSKIAQDKAERSARFLEEALELFQACGRSKEDAQVLLDYVYSRPMGTVPQEAAGTLLTLAILCAAYRVDLMHVGDMELRRVYEKILDVRQKQLQKPPVEGSELYPQRRG